MSLSDSQKRAQAKYNRDKVNQINLKFYPSERQLWDALQLQENKSRFIKEAIKEALEL